MVERRPNQTDIYRRAQRHPDSYAQLPEVTPELFLNRSVLEGYHLCVDCEGCRIPEDAIGLQLLTDPGNEYFLFHISVVDVSALVHPYSDEAFYAYRRRQNTYNSGKAVRIFPQNEESLCLCPGKLQPTVTLTVPYSPYRGFEAPYFWLTLLDVNRKMTFQEADELIHYNMTSDGTVLRSFSWLAENFKTRRKALEKGREDRTVRLYDYIQTSGPLSFQKKQNEKYVKASEIITQVKVFLNASTGAFIRERDQHNQDSSAQAGVVYRRHTGEPATKAFNTTEVGPHNALCEDPYVIAGRALRDANAYASQTSLTDVLKGGEPTLLKSDLQKLLNIP